MRAADTNVLVRAVMRDDIAQADIAAQVLTESELVAVALPCLCDFADGVIAYEGHWLGGETFVSFDKKAVTLLGGLGLSSRLL